MTGDRLPPARISDSSDPPTASEGRGPLAWMAKNGVAANIIMLFLVVAGLFQMCSIKEEVFPESELDIIVVNIPYPGASPSEVEEGVLLAAEEAVRAIDGIKKVTATATESFGVLVIELLIGTDADQTLDKVQSALDRVTSFPDPVVNEGAIAIFKASTRRSVTSLVLYGDASEASLRVLAERTRDELLQDSRITYVELAGVRPLEISIEVPQEKLREVGMSIEQVAAIIRQSSIELPGGEVKTAGGNLLVRTTERRISGEEFAEIALLSRPDGTTLRLGDVADIRDAFAEVDAFATFNGKRAVMIQVFRSGEQGPIDVSEAVHEYRKKNLERMPDGVEIAVWADTSEIYASRVDLLKRNALLGLILVLIVLSLFLEVKLAFWVTLGIPITFVGAFLFLPTLDVSINMISLFAFIVVLGMVVDDAIIVGEAIFKQRQDGHAPLRAAILGVKEVATPVCFAILTTIFAFMPMLFIPGPVGKFFRVIPLVVITVFVLSLFESLFILPAHLAHSHPTSTKGLFGPLRRAQMWFAAGVERFIMRRYQPLLRRAVSAKWLTLATGFAIFFGSIGMCTGGRVKQTFLPKVDSDVVIAQTNLPFGSTVQQSEAMLELMLRTAGDTISEYGTEEELSRGIFAQIGSHTAGGIGNPNGGSSASGTHLVEVAIYFVGSDIRPMKSGEFARGWREKLEAEATGLEALKFNFQTGPSGGKPIHVDLTFTDREVLGSAALWFSHEVADLTGTYDVDDGFARGKEQLDLRLKPAARSLGVTEIDLARQIRSAFFGAEAVRQQRGRDEVRVYVRLPRSERDSEYHLENLMIRTPSGGEVPLVEAATIKRGRAYTEITRVDGRRVQSVTAEVDAGVGNAKEINAKIISEVVPRFKETFPGVAIGFGGEAQEQGDVNKSLMYGFLTALFAMFALLAISFRSYVQPFIVLMAIPFGFVGALWGHVLLGFSWSMMSTMGMVALSGVIINDSLILVVAINKYHREDGLPLVEAVVAGGLRRFRPIILTSLTTFFGLAPMILETSVQARFLVPMAVSLGFGVMLGTFVLLLIVPAAYMALDSIKRGLARPVHGYQKAWKDVFGGSDQSENEAQADPAPEADDQLD